MLAALLTLALAAAPAQGAAGSPARAVLLAHADCLKLPADDRPFVRYLWTSSAPKYREDFLAVLSFHVNLLSDQGKTYHPTLIAPDLVRVDVRDYGWDKRLEVYEQLVKVDVFFHSKAKLLRDLRKTKEKDERPVVYWPGGIDPDDGTAYKRGAYPQTKKAGDVIDVAARWLPQKEIDGLREMTYSEAPVLVAEWFFVQSARQVSIRNKQEGAGYYDFLGLKTRDDFFALTGTDVKVAERVFAEWRAVVDRSGVSQQNRQVIRYGSASRSVRGTLDTFTQQGKGNAKRNLRRGELAHDVEEWIGFTPAGLPVTFLSNNKGEAAESAPDKIGPDDSPLRVGRDARVHANLSCIRCHGIDRDFVKPVDDWARRTFRAGGVLRLQDKDKKVILELESQYLRDLNELLDDDRAAYVRGLARATASARHPKGLTWPQVTRLYGTAWNRYVEEQVALEDAAREIGADSRTLLAALERYAYALGKIDLILAGFIDRPAQKITRLEWEDSCQLAAALVWGVVPPEVERLEKQKGDFDKGG